VEGWLGEAKSWKGQRRKKTGKNNQLEMSKEKGKVLKLKMKEEGGIFGGEKRKTKEAGKE
jgi:hypothetical protein